MKIRDSGQELLDLLRERMKVFSFANLKKHTAGNRKRFLPEAATTGVVMFGELLFDLGQVVGLV